MSKTKKIIVISLVCVAIISILTITIGLFINSILPKTFSSAKKECEKVLNKHQIEMEQIAVDSLKSGKSVSGEFKGYVYSCYIEDGLIIFNIDAQGMLGGQCWELVYTQDGTFYGQTESYLYEEPFGNNIMKAERLNEHWWFLWTDYDGDERSFR